jgi:hypothetical protein
VATMSEMLPSPRNSCQDEPARSYTSPQFANVSLRTSYCVLFIPKQGSPEMDGENYEIGPRSF